MLKHVIDTFSYQHAAPVKSMFNGLKTNDKSEVWCFSTSLQPSTV